MRSKKRLLAWLALLLSFGLLAAACGDDEDSGDDTGDGGGDVSGAIEIEGSSTVFPITDAAKFAFQQENGDVELTVGNEGTTVGFEAFCSGTTDIADASRPIKDEEAAACADANVEYVELEIGLDGLTVMVHPSNELECLSKADLYALIGPEAQDKVSSWQDAQALATELGSETAMPDAELFLTGPGQESGTYGSFIELALDPVTKERFAADKVEAEKGLIRSDYTQSGDDPRIISGIEDNDGSLGWVGFAYAEEAGEGVKELSIANDDGDCIAPDAETIADGSYPLSRSLYIYVKKESIETKPQVVSFVDFYLEGLSDYVTAGGYVEIPEDRLTATNDAWTEAKG